MRRLIQITCVIGHILFLTLAAQGDIVVTKSGSKYEGALTEDGDNYVLTTSSGGKMFFPKSMVKEIVREQMSPEKTARRAKAGDAFRSFASLSEKLKAATRELSAMEVRMRARQQGELDRVRDPLKVAEAETRIAVVQRLMKTGAIRGEETIVLRDEGGRQQTVSVSYTRENAKGLLADAEKALRDAKAVPAEFAAEQDKESAACKAAKGLLDRADQMVRGTIEALIPVADDAEALKHAVGKRRAEIEGMLHESRAIVSAIPKLTLDLGKALTLDLGKALTLDLGNGLRMKLALIPDGKFLMGNLDSKKERDTENEGPQHEVAITKPFWMGLYEVTQEQYQAVMGRNPSSCKDGKNPVENVSWNDAVEFCEKLSHRTGKTVSLPTEAQWEYACRAGSKTRFSYGDNDADLGDYAWYYKTGGQAKPVGGKKPNAFVLYDMHGNVWELCSDWYVSSYANAKNVDPSGPASGINRVVRGGGFGYGAGDCSSASRDGRSPGDRSYDVGFRVVVREVSVD